MVRQVWIDYAKTIGILLIVYCHLPQSPFSFSFLWTFHVPLFFFIAGYLTKTDGDFLIKKKVNRLLIPYVGIYMISALIFYLTLSFTGKPIDSGNVLNTCLGLFWGNHTFPNYINPPLWFLPSLFSADLLTAVFIRKFKPGLILLPIISLYLYTNGYLNLFLSIDLTLLGINYFLLGLWMKKINLNEIVSKSNPLLCIFIGFILFAIVYYFAGTGNVWFKGEGIFGYSRSLIGGISGIFFVIFISVLFEKTLGDRMPVRFISENTLLILGFHAITNLYAEQLIHKIQIIPNILMNTVVTLISVILLIPFILGINRYLPALSGRK